MVDTLNACGLNYACFGNHECDVPYDEMIKRIKESKFTWYVA
jgi:5'-nucleotidase